MCKKSESMIKTITIVAILSLGVSFNSYADDGDRIDQLKKEVQELELRISKLESLLSDASESKEIVPSHEGWKSLSNWRKLSTDMGYDEVETMLGTPERVDGGNIARWQYPNGGDVTFMRGKVHSWSEPRK